MIRLTHHGVFRVSRLCGPQPRASLRGPALTIRSFHQTTPRRDKPTTLVNSSRREGYGGEWVKNQSKAGNTLPRSTPENSNASQDATAALRDGELHKEHLAPGNHEVSDTVQDLASILQTMNLNVKRVVHDHEAWTALVAENPPLWACIPHDLFEIVHDLIPLWAISIPVATVAIRFMVTGLIKVINARGTSRLETVHAFKLAYEQATKRRKPVEPFSVDASGMPIIVVPREVHLKSWHNAIMKRYKASQLRITLWNLVNIPVWLATVETLRSMVGCKYGVIGLFCRSLGLLPGESEILHPLMVKPLMSSEGALWFADLTVPDPTGCLSVILGLAIARSIFQATASLRKPSFIDEGGRYRKYWVRAVPLGGLIIVPLTLQFPAALLLYWASSTISAPIISSFFKELSDKKKPISATIKPLTTGFDGLTSSQWLMEPSVRPRHLRLPQQRKRPSGPQTKARP
jgi:inner membrane protein COX18